MTLEEQIELAKIGAQLHSIFWDHEILKHPTVCNGDPTTATIFYEGWARGACSTEGVLEQYHDALLKAPISCNLFERDDDKTCVRLLKAHHEPIFAEMKRVLDTRPFTLVHGDMRTDNLFQRKDKTGFKVIDWQTYGATTPGMEVHQLLCDNMTNFEDYEQLPTIMRAYLAELHRLCPAARSYTWDMYWEDSQVCVAIGMMCIAGALGGIVAELPADAPNMLLFCQFFPRLKVAYRVLDVSGVVMRLAKRLGLSVDPAIPFYDAAARD